MQSEFLQLYRVLIPSSNNCGACGVTKCYFCVKFDINCARYKFRRCVSCVKFVNCLNLFYKHSRKEQWDYICNFLHDMFRLHSKTREHFKDVSTPIQSSIRDMCFIISNTKNNKIKNDIRKRSIYCTLGYRKYFCFLVINNFFVEREGIKYFSVSKNATVPTKATSGSAGFDLYSAVDKEIKPWTNGIASTDLKFKIPFDMFGKIFTRSGQFIKNKFTVEAGVTDSDYRGVVNILLFSHYNLALKIEKRQRVAQIVFLKKVNVNFNQVQSFEHEVDNERNDSGLGSSGDF